MGMRLEVGRSGAEMSQKGPERLRVLFGSSRMARDMIGARTQGSWPQVQPGHTIFPYHLIRTDESCSLCVLPRARKIGRRVFLIIICQ